MKTLAEIASKARSPISFTTYDDPSRGRTNSASVARRMKALGAKVKIDRRVDSEGKRMPEKTTWELIAE